MNNIVSFAFMLDLKFKPIPLSLKNNSDSMTCHFCKISTDKEEIDTIQKR